MLKFADDDETWAAAAVGAFCDLLLFAAKLAMAGAVLFYAAGHGPQVARPRVYQLFPDRQTSERGSFLAVYPPVWKPEKEAPRGDSRRNREPAPERGRRMDDV